MLSTILSLSAPLSLSLSLSLSLRNNGKVEYIGLQFKFNEINSLDFEEICPYVHHAGI